MSITRFETGPRMSQAVVHGDTIYLAGVVADAPAGKDVGAQTQSVLGKIDALLAAAGSDKTRVLSAQIWLADMGTFAAMNAVWDAWVAPGCTPARATVEARLATPDYTVEIMIVAAR
ncbi:MAG: RidA family protein [Hyphomonadaceae bacterium]|nr:RidA family protein [Hyphomonadaceae bacterium]